MTVQPSYNHNSSLEEYLRMASSASDIHRMPTSSFIHSERLEPRLRRTFSSHYGELRGKRRAAEHKAPRLPSKTHRSVASPVSLSTAVNSDADRPRRASDHTPPSTSPLHNPRNQLLRLSTGSSNRRLQRFEQSPPPPPSTAQRTRVRLERQRSDVYKRSLVRTLAGSQSGLVAQKNDESRKTSSSKVTLSGSSMEDNIQEKITVLQFDSSKRNHLTRMHCSTVSLEGMDIFNEDEDASSSKEMDEEHSFMLLQFDSSEFNNLTHLSCSSISLD